MTRWCSDTLTSTCSTLERRRCVLPHLTHGRAALAPALPPHLCSLQGHRGKSIQKKYYSLKILCNFHDRVVSSVIEDTIKNFLFQSSAPLESSNKNQHEGSPDRNKVAYKCKHNNITACRTSLLMLAIILLLCRLPKLMCMACFCQKQTL